jgi:hypothetical protein
VPSPARDSVGVHIESPKAEDPAALLAEAFSPKELKEMQARLWAAHASNVNAVTVGVEAAKPIAPELAAD